MPRHYAIFIKTCHVFEETLLKNAWNCKLGRRELPTISDVYNLECILLCENLTLRASIRLSTNFIETNRKNTIIFSNIVSARKRLCYRVKCLRDFLILGVITYFPSSFSKNRIPVSSFFLHLSAASCVRCWNNYSRKAIDFKCLEMSQCKNEKSNSGHKWLKLVLNRRDENLLDFISELHS